MSALALVGARVGYDGGDVVHDLHLRVAPGEVVALLGVNGAGKTAAVRAIGGLLALRSGSVELLGADATTEPTHRRAARGLRVVTDDRPLCAAMTVSENLRLAANRADHTDDVLEWLPQLNARLRQAAGTLSGGEQCMLAAARALVGRPGMIVVDELSAGLAPAAAASVLSALRQAATLWGTGVLVVEQATKLALEHADRAVVLARGRVAVEGPAADLARRRDVLETAYLGRF